MRPLDFVIAYHENGNDVNQGKQRAEILIRAIFDGGMKVSY